jgi:hypothetical protein
MKSRNDFISDGLHIFAAIALLTAVAGPSVADDELEKAKNIIAAQIRDQGYKCDKASGAVRDAEASKPDEAVWLLTCEDASYRVRLVPDMAARVERLSGKKTQP